MRQISVAQSLVHCGHQSTIACEKSRLSTVGVPPDTFGNLCLISRSNNSKLNNLIPDAKKGHFSESTAVESLKQVFMLTYSAWGPKNEAAIRHHEKMMIDVLCTQAAQGSAPS